MAEEKNLHQVGDRIERLLEEIRSMTSPPAWERVEEVMSSVVKLRQGGHMGPHRNCLGARGRLSGGLQPPKILMLKIHPDVRIGARVVAVRED